MTPQELKQYRKSEQLTQQELADCLGVHQVTVARWETNVMQVPETTARVLRMLPKLGHRPRVLLDAAQ